MPKFVIEREMPGAGELTPEQLRGASRQSCRVLLEIGPTVQWVQSFVTGDKIYCIYNAPDADALREHAQKAGFPANAIAQVSAVIDPTAAE